MVAVPPPAPIPSPIPSQGCQRNNSISFTFHAISRPTSYAGSVFAADLNNDSHVDVLAASSDDDTIAWFENDGETPPGFAPRLISNLAYGAFSVYAADLDNDGDVDVLSASSGDWTIAWYENSGGSSPVFLRRVITNLAVGARSVYAADVDGDGDVDVLSASDLDDKIAWYENDGGTPPTFAKRVITSLADGAYSVYAADLDNDGDVDVLSASFNDDTIAWYENDGAFPPSFTRRVITSTADGARDVYAADLNRDGHLDVISASFNDDTIAWYENDGTSSPSFLEWTITATRDGAISVTAGDLDNDGNLDVVAASLNNRASLNDNTIAWFENQGFAPNYFPDFTVGQTISTGANSPRSVYAIDLDNDGDVDVLTFYFDTIAWYENDCVVAQAPVYGPVTPSPTSHRSPSPTRTLSPMSHRSSSKKSSSQSVPTVAICIVVLVSIIASCLVVRKARTCYICSASTADSKYMKIREKELVQGTVVPQAKMVDSILY